MPGGRGTPLQLADALNFPKHKQIAKAIKMAMDNNEYIIQASLGTLGAGLDKCQHEDTFIDVWCHALETHKVDWSGY